MPSPLAGHAVNPPLEARWRHPCRHTVPQAVRTPHQNVGRLLETCTPTTSTGPCPPTVAGPYAAWMPRKSLHGRTCGVSRDGGRARALQPNHRPAALQLTETWLAEGAMYSPENLLVASLKATHTDHHDRSLPPTVAGPYAAWMPRKSLQGRTCGVSRDGGRARALQPNHRPAAPESLLQRNTRKRTCVQAPSLAIAVSVCVPTSSKSR
ncbi:hypothetical protein LMG31886_31990 [Xanthomonas hydrangeae]|nr:hypothetical protein LMG31884_32740 [Xanthomonas hydrangeae]CAD7721184.1 hypothetical protein LMG31884_32740 [Xanthomonas hydrangeae]CAD7738124.1 hypothetical protein LMG31887_32640 [Xanthomonas hydrangeae]CAD7738127.1 hypothetical protein LMG31887_32640 [Xanthomonas hydrangeae]CAD7738413.1 hypothetical protein LMG31885_28410 [Xanthomonas hydrangeae]